MFETNASMLCFHSDPKFALQDRWLAFPGVPAYAGLSPLPFPSHLLLLLPVPKSIFHCLYQSALSTITVIQTSGFQGTHNDHETLLRCSRPWGCRRQRASKSIFSTPISILVFPQRILTHIKPLFTVLAPCGTSCPLTAPNILITRSTLPTETSSCLSLLVSSIAMNATSGVTTDSLTSTHFVGGANHVAGSLGGAALGVAALAFAL